jgi:hypothetical protein
MIGFKDFTPECTRESTFFSDAEYEKFGTAVAAANEWIKTSGVRVLNVETVVLPNMWSECEEGTEDPNLLTSQAALWHQFVRVWYAAG